MNMIRSISVLGSKMMAFRTKLESDKPPMLGTTAARLRWGQA